MAERPVLRVQADASALAAISAEIERLYPNGMSEAQLDRARQLGELLLQIVEGAPELGQTVAFEPDRAAARTGDLTIAVRPTQLLFDGLAALRAIHGEVDVV